MLDTGATAFMLVSAMLVFLMTPGVAFFYGGLARRKNVVNTMFMSFVIIGVVAIVWILAGWSLAYGGDGSNPFFGGFDQLGCMGAATDMLAEAVDPRRFDVSRNRRYCIPGRICLHYCCNCWWLSCWAYEVWRFCNFYYHLDSSDLCPSRSYGMGRRR